MGLGAGFQLDGLGEKLKAKGLSYATTRAGDFIWGALPLTAGMRPPASWARPVECVLEIDLEYRPNCGGDDDLHFAMTVSFLVSNPLVR